MDTLRAPRCLVCGEIVAWEELVFEAVCGHEDCPTACFHSRCLFNWREQRESAREEFERFVASHDIIIIRRE